ncbi:MAG: hypothetical protein RLZZ330_872 [Actinomycetota bacterium]|jgi:peptide-methionine (R)-S-oxide reductase
MDFESVDFLTEISFPAKGIRAVMIQNSNGGWVDSSSGSRGLSNHDDLQWLLAHRYVADAVLVGSTTAIAENYKPISPGAEIMNWRKGHGLKENPSLVVVSASLVNVKKLLDFADYVITTKDIATQIDEPKLIASGDSQVDLRIAVEKLNEMGLIRISCEGGPKLLEQLIKMDLVDQFVLTRSPIEGAASESQDINNFIEQLQLVKTYQVEEYGFSHYGVLPMWEELLTVGEYFVLRDSGTQAPFSVDYEKKSAAGYYTCRSCGAKLFDASDQFDARCGWPAFWKPNDNANLILEDDFSKGYVRVEVKCGTCESHLGHVFHGEGFGFPTDDRYCINAICLVRKYDE